ncbi:glucokinase [uncultured Psychrosphaera sp.]|uniref:glucokinase n=1 Tax=uncultured Psychrosphaera sp. TaxID=1403522 RepID=UPI0030F86689
MTIKALVADIGGTNIRLGMADMETLSISNILTYQCKDFDNVDGAISQYKQDSKQEFEYACLDVACPVVGDEVNLTNNHWCFSQTAITEQFGLKKLIVINDFTAIAMSVPNIAKDKLVQIGGQDALPNAPIAIFGAGTGLGVANLIHAENKWIPIGGEGGHVDFAPIDSDEIGVLKELQKKYARVSAEQVLSGLGLVQIYQSLCAINKQDAKQYEPADITQHAIAGTDELAVKTLDVFCRILGSFGGNLALTLMTYGGVFIAGGVVPRFIEYVKTSEFRARFDAKGRFGKIIKTIPVYVVTEEQPGLIGCAAYLQQEI